MADPDNFRSPLHFLLFKFQAEPFIKVGVDQIDPDFGGFTDRFFGMDAVIPRFGPPAGTENGVDICMSAAVKLDGFMGPERPCHGMRYFHHFLRDLQLMKI